MAEFMMPNLEMISWTDTSTADFQAALEIINRQRGGLAYIVTKSSHSSVYLCFCSAVGTIINNLQNTQAVTIVLEKLRDRKTRKTVSAEKKGEKHCKM